MDFANRSNQSRTNRFERPAKRIIRRELIAHLRNDIRLLSNLRQSPRFTHITAERLLAVNMLAQSHCFQCCGRVSVVGRADDDRVDLLGFLVEHLAEAEISFGVWMLLGFRVQLRVVDIAQRDDLA